MDEQRLAELERIHGLPEGMLKAVMMVESSGRPDAVSPKGALGAFQLMPQTAAMYGVDPRDPAQAAGAAAKYLKEQYQRFGNWKDALAAYNAGPTRVARAKRRGGALPRETRNYVRKLEGAFPNPDAYPPPMPPARPEPALEQQMAEAQGGALAEVQQPSAWDTFSDRLKAAAHSVLLPLYDALERDARAHAPNWQPSPYSQAWDEMMARHRQQGGVAALDERGLPTLLPVRQPQGALSRYVNGRIVDNPTEHVTPPPLMGGVRG